MRPLRRSRVNAPDKLLMLRVHPLFEDDLMTDKVLSLTAAQIQQQEEGRRSRKWWSLARRPSTELNKADPAAPGSISLTP